MSMIPVNAETMLSPVTTVYKMAPKAAAAIVPIAYSAVAVCTQAGLPPESGELQPNVGPPGEAGTGEVRAEPDSSDPRPSLESTRVMVTAMTKTAAVLLALLLASVAGCGATDVDPPGKTATVENSSDPTGKGEAVENNADPTDEVLTVENNADLAALLHGPATGKDVEAFSEEYRIKTVEFEGLVADIYINPREHHGTSTINVMGGDANDPNHTGPVFQLSWYGHEDPKEKLVKGDNVRVRASVGIVNEFDPHQFYLVDEGVNALEPR